MEKSHFSIKLSKLGTIIFLQMEITQPGPLPPPLSAIFRIGATHGLPTLPRASCTRENGSRHSAIAAAEQLIAYPTLTCYYWAILQSDRYTIVSSEL